MMAMGRPRTCWSVWALPLADRLFIALAHSSASSGGAVYLADYAAQPDFRRSINRLLVRGESVHQLERVIHAGPIRHDRARRREERVMISGALTLLTNAVITYNTWKLHQVIERRKACNRPVPTNEILAHIAPIAFRHINFHGTYRFPIERYLDRLLPSVSAPRASAGT